jgi:hypothetical protein
MPAIGKKNGNKKTKGGLNQRPQTTTQVLPLGSNSDYDNNL